MIIKKDNGSWALVSSDGSRELLVKEDRADLEIMEPHVAPDDYLELTESVPIHLSEDLLEKIEAGVLPIVVVEAGLSSNNRNYSSELLQKPESSKAFEGKPVFGWEFKGSGGVDYNHIPEGLENEAFARNKLGSLKNVRFGEFAKKVGTGFGLVADFLIVSPWLKESLTNVIKHGLLDEFYGFSLDAFAKVERQTVGG